VLAPTPTGSRQGADRRHRGAGGRHGNEPERDKDDRERGFPQKEGRGSALALSPPRATVAPFPFASATWRSTFSRAPSSLKGPTSRPSPSFITRRHGLPVDAPRLLSEPFDEGRRVGDLATCLRKGLAPLQRHHPGKLLLTLVREPGRLPHDPCPVLWAVVSPHPACARAAASVASRISTRPASGIVATISPDAGFTTSKVAPDAAASSQSPHKQPDDPCLFKCAHGILPDRS